MCSKSCDIERRRELQRLATEKYRLNNRDRYLASKRNRYSENRDKNRIARRQWYLKNKDKVKIWQTKNRESIRRATEKYRTKNKEKVKQRRIEIYRSIPKEIRAQKYTEKNRNRANYSRRWYLENRSRCLDSQKRYYENNKDSSLSKHSKRRARIHLSFKQNADPILIKGFYAVARRVSKCLGIKHHVDHIIPIAKNGPHHQDNLQILPWRINFRKGSKIINAE